MTPQEIKSRCRIAYVITEDNHVFDQDYLNNVSTQIYRCKEYAEKEAKFLQNNLETMEYYRNRKGRKIRVCPVYLVPASKIDD